MLVDYNSKSVTQSQYILYFYAEWQDTSLHLQAVFKEMSTLHPGVTVYRVDSDVNSKLCLEHNVTSVPTVLFFKNGNVVRRIEGLMIKEIIEEMSKMESIPIEARLKQLITRSRIMLFIKGTRDAPQCGFTRKILNYFQNVTFDTFDILTDPEVRQGLKELSQWPTYPQVYVDGELIGGLDIISQLSEQGELESILKSEN